MCVVIMWREASCLGLPHQKGDAVHNTYMAKLEFGEPINYLWPETPLDGHNFDTWQNLKNGT